MASSKLKSMVNKMKFESVGFKKYQHDIGLVDEDGLLIYFERRPLYFRDCQNTGKGIYFSNYFSWMGKVRESAMLPILKEISDDFNTGTIGMVTNNSTVTIVGDAEVGEIMETRFGLVKKVNDSTLQLFFEWKIISADGSYKDLAYGEMEISWVKILSHGIVKAEPFPEYYNHFLNKMAKDVYKSTKNMDIEKTFFTTSEKGDLIHSAPISPRRGYQLHEEYIDTSLEDGNSVGNLYFSNYGRWQGIVRDRFFHQINKKYFENMGEEGELVTVDVSVHHLRESMPFSRILVKMNLVEMYEKSIVLTFSYYNVDDENHIKLATGVQTIVWAKKTDNSQYIPLAWPVEYKNNLLKYIKE